MSQALLAEAESFAADLARRIGAGEVPGVQANRWQGSPSDADARAAYAEYGAAGLIGLHWPRRLGGREESPVDTVRVEEILGYHWLPLSSYLLSVKTIGNALLQHATPAVCERLLPEIAAGRLVFCQGFSEPEAGSDLAALRTRAVRRGDRWVVDGRKIWTSSAEHADWIYLAVRSDPDEPRHRGLTVLVCPIDTPGVEVTTHATLGGGTLGEVLLDHVEIPAELVVGEVGGGWAVLMSTLDHERVTSEKVGVVLRLLDDLDPWLTSASQRRAALRLRGEAETARRHGLRATRLLAAGVSAPAASSAAKLTIALLMQRLAAFAVEVLGPLALVEDDDGGEALLHGRVAAFARSAYATTIAGGASDIQRRVIARQGLGLGA